LNGIAHRSNDPNPSRPISAAPLAGIGRTEKLDADERVRSDLEAKL